VPKEATDAQVVSLMFDGVVLKPTAAPVAEQVESVAPAPVVEQTPVAVEQTPVAEPPAPVVEQPKPAKSGDLLSERKDTRSDDTLATYVGSAPADQDIVRRNAAGVPRQLTTRVGGEKATIQPLGTKYKGMTDTQIIEAFRPAAPTPAATQQTSNVVPINTKVKNSTPVVTKLKETQEEVAASAAAVQLTEDADAAADDTAVLNAIKEAAKEDKTPGGVLFPVQVFAAIRNSILSPTSGVQVRQVGKIEKDKKATKKWGKGVRAVSTAARDLIFAMNEADNAGGNLVRSDVILGQTKLHDTRDDDKNAASRAKRAVADRNAKNATVIEAIAQLEKAVTKMGGTRKDMDAIVQVVKTRVQERAVKGKAPKQWAKLDVNLSRAWGEFKQGAFDDNQFVRGSKSRNSKEEGGKGATPLEKAAEGTKNFKGDDVATGITGLMRKMKKEGTVYERMLATALEKAFTSMGGTAPALQFYTPKSREPAGTYTPTKHLITISKNASPEVQLHEALHGALRWFVHANRENEYVVALDKALQTVLEQKGLSNEALRVQVLLTKLAKRSRADAILELVSYGNTLNEFRQALEKIKSKPGVNRNFLQAAQDIWKSILNIVSELLNKPNTVAADVIQNTFKLLEQVTQDGGNVPKTEAERKGNKLNQQAETLNASITSRGNSPLPPGKSATNHYMSQASKSLLSSQMLFNALGWDKVPGKVQKMAASVAASIRKDFPGAERLLSNINANFSISEPVRIIKENFKYDKNNGNQYTELVANQIANRDAAYNETVFAYLDGDTKALDGMPADGGKLKSQLDAILEHYDEYIEELPKKEQAYFKNNKFTDTLIYPLKSANVAGTSLSAQGVAQYIGLKTDRMDEISASLPWMATNAQGDIDIGDKFYQVLEPDKLNTSSPTLLKAGYMSKSVFDASGPPADPLTGLPLSVDTSRQWTLDSKNKGKYVFKSNMTSAQALKELNALDRANALRNTMAALSVHFAARNHSRALAALGRDANGEPTVTSVVFDSVEQIEQVTGQKVDPERILIATDKEAQNAMVLNKYRATGSWVRVPVSKSKDGQQGYGPLAGKLVPGPVWNSMNDMNDRQPIIKARLYTKTLTLFKKSKTTLNPGTHVTNTLTNFTLAYMHDITYAQLKVAARVYAKYHASPTKLTPSELAMMNDFIKSGAMLGDFSISEVKNSLFAAFDSVKDPRAGTSLLDQMNQYAAYEKAKMYMGNNLLTRSVAKGADVMGQTYAAEDNVFRMAAFMKTLGELQARGGDSTTNVRESGRVARDLFLDYDIDSRAVKIARQTAFPFIAWTYGIIPLLGRIALHQPWKIVNVLTAYQLTAVAMGAMAGDDEEQRAAGPDYLKERMFGFGPYMHMRVPFAGDAQNPVYWRLGDYFPMASGTKGLPNGFLGQSKLPQFMSPSNPFSSLIITFMGGVDPYTGKPIHEVTDSDFEKLLNAATAGYNIMAPPIISSRNGRAVKRALDGNTGITGASPSSTVFARALGMRLYQHNVDEEAAFKDIRESAISLDFDVAISKAKREELNKGYPDYAKLDKKLDKLLEEKDAALLKVRGE